MIETLIDHMRENSSEFASSGIYNRKMVKSSCAVLGFDAGKYQNKIVSVSDRVDRGVYRIHDFSHRAGPKPVKSGKMPTAKVAAPAEMNFVSTKIQPVQLPKSEVLSVGTIPTSEPGYVPFGTYKNVESVLKSRRFFPIYLTGHSGNGKSSMIIDICAKHKIKMIRLNCSVQSDEEKLIGSKTLRDGNIEIVDGPVLSAMRSGSLLVAEEIDALDPKLALVLQGICEGRPFFFALTGEYIVPAHGFNIVGIGNTKGQGGADGKYLGTNIQNSAFLERFGCTYVQEFPPAAAETKMILNWMKINNCTNVSVADSLVKWANAVRKTYADGGIEDMISTRRLNHIVVAYAIYEDIHKAVELCTNRFDDFTSAAFRNLFSKICVEEIPEVETLPMLEVKSKETE
jgi:hypothetical protein